MLGFFLPFNIFRARLSFRLSEKSFLFLYKTSYSVKKSLALSESSVAICRTKLGFGIDAAVKSILFNAAFSRGISHRQNASGFYFFFSLAT